MTRFFLSAFGLLSTLLFSYRIGHIVVQQRPVASQSFLVLNPFACPVSVQELFELERTLHHIVYLALQLLEHAVGHPLLLLRFIERIKTHDELNPLLRVPLGILGVNRVLYVQ